MKRHLLFFAVVTVVLLLLLLGTNPTQVPSFVLIIPFALLFVLLFAALLLLLKGKKWTKAKKLRASLVFSGIPITLLVLQSVGQLTVRDIVTIAAIFLVAYFYLSRVAVTE